jgi:single-stranded DNA-binding protein
MTDLNHVVLIGRLTRDLGSDERSFGYIGNGTARANVSIAVNRSKKNGDTWSDEVHYFDVTIWGKQAENLKQLMKTTAEPQAQQQVQQGQPQSQPQLVPQPMGMGGSPM